MTLWQCSIVKNTSLTNKMLYVFGNYCFFSLAFKDKIYHIRVYLASNQLNKKQLNHRFLLIDVLCHSMTCRFRFGNDIESDNFLAEDSNDLWCVPEECNWRAKIFLNKINLWLLYFVYGWYHYKCCYVYQVSESVLLLLLYAGWTKPYINVSWNIPFILLCYCHGERENNTHSDNTFRIVILLLRYR